MALGFLIHDFVLSQLIELIWWQMNYTLEKLGNFPVRLPWVLPYTENRV